MGQLLLSGISMKPIGNGLNFAQKIHIFIEQTTEVIVPFEEGLRKTQLHIERMINITYG